MELEEVAGVLRDWARKRRVIERLWLFGSRVPESGKLPHPGSDLDVAVDMTLADWAFYQRCLPSSARHIGLPWPVHVNLYNPQTSGSHHIVWSEVNRYGRLVYVRESD